MIWIIFHPLLIRIIAPLHLFYQVLIFKPSIYDGSRLNKKDASLLLLDIFPIVVTVGQNNDKGKPPMKPPIYSVPFLSEPPVPSASTSGVIDSEYCKRSSGDSTSNSIRGEVLESGVSNSTYYDWSPEDSTNVSIKEASSKPDVINIDYCDWSD